jgi:hypothetical protein
MYLGLSPGEQDYWIKEYEQILSTRIILIYNANNNVRQ